MADCLLIKIFEAYIKNNSNSDLTLVPGKELQDVNEITKLIDTAIKFYTPKKHEQNTAETCRKLRELFNVNLSQAKSEWDRVVQEAQQLYEEKFYHILEIDNIKVYTESEVHRLLSHLSLWTEEYIKQKLDLGKPVTTVCKNSFGSMRSIMSDPFFTKWDIIISYLKKCKEYLEKEYDITFSESVMTWMDILRYWKFISPLYDNHTQGRKEDVYTGFDTTTDSGLKRLYQKFDDIYCENRSNSSLNGKEYQKILEEISKFLRNCCESVDRFNGYILRLEQTNHEDLVQDILYLADIKARLISFSHFDRAVELAQLAKISAPELFVKQLLSDYKINFKIRE